MWRTIKVVRTRDWHNLDTTERQRVHVAKFLRLSSSYPLTIDFTFRAPNTEAFAVDAVYPDSETMDDVYLPVIDMMAAVAHHAHRIKHFRLSANEATSPFMPTSLLLNKSMPLLTHWEVRNVYHETQPSFREDLQAYLGKKLHPNVRCVVLRAVKIPWKLFQATDLTSLEISMPPRNPYTSPSLLRQIIDANFLSLKNLVLLAATSFHLPFLSPDIFLPNLNSLSLGFIFAHDLVAFIRLLDAPQLKELALSDCNWEMKNHDPSWWTDKIVQLVTRIRRHLPLRQLIRLELRHIAFCPSVPQFTRDEDDICVHCSLVPDFFAELSSLKQLVLRGPDDATLAALNANVRDDVLVPQRPLLPSLKTLVLEEVSIRELKWLFGSRAHESTYTPFVALGNISVPWIPRQVWFNHDEKRLRTSIADSTRQSFPADDLDQGPIEVEEPGLADVYYPPSAVRF
ncbi:hypothetical protein H0H92_006142 [Tricholoma furcatifolium]|nr:hypothetical protein H0H92_006142 [Tricholoma furcatifolium]